MKLVSIEVEGYRRFEDRQRLLLDGRIVALLGPNEAGKTSLLRALQALNSGAPFKANGPSQEITRGRVLSSDQIILGAKLLLDSSDIDVLKAIDEAVDVRWLSVKKTVGGKIKANPLPAVSRNPAHREKLIEILEGVVSSSAGKDADEAAAQAKRLAEAALLAIPDSNAKTLSSEAIQKLRDLLRHYSTQEQQGAWLTTFSELVSYEEREHPAKTAAKLLLQRLPQFVVFADEDRSLASNYDLRAFFAKPNPKNNQRVEPTPIPRALQNLADAAGLSLEGLFLAGQNDDQGAIQTLLSAANTAIRERISKQWKQSKLEVVLQVNNNVLTILVRSSGGQFERLSERSDGLRQFVALAAFLSKREGQKADVILLIDEVEAHLHYDAQADLVQMLTSQELARQVIYTTHSIGCFPEDFGASVRVIRPKDGSRSEILDKLWVQDGVGLSPILTGMGAETMAFFPFRNCVLMEGAGDMLLLPLLLREALKSESLGFCVLPGLAELHGQQIPIIQNSGRRVVFLLDGDGGGDGIQKKLVRAGANKELILRLVGDGNMKYVIEDFVAKEVYVGAVNEELRRSGHSTQISAHDLPESLRPAALKNWCVQHEVNQPAKVNLAYRVIDESRERSVVDAAKVEHLQSIYNRIAATFARKDPAIQA